MVNICYTLYKSQLVKVGSKNTSHITFGKVGSKKNTLHITFVKLTSHLVQFG
jgi:hypothetical protein